MLTKEFAILMVFCFGLSNMPLKSTPQERPAKVSASPDPKRSKSIPVDTTNRQNTAYIKEIKYIQDAKFNKFAKITIKNITNQVISEVSFNLRDSIDQGGRNCYEVKRKTKLQPNQSLIILQRLNKGDDRKAHTIGLVKMKYNMNINFTLD
ncbi:hypothetical protein [Pedobacter psychrodurus]|uniref:hypothetical protein n=1 Tax=Pedobacter psychrodurus TaxID=2530456 RepID=UPI0029303A49|nr:hypothetical protein [Pedobacter psychrodurus]